MSSAEDFVAEIRDLRARLEAKTAELRLLKVQDEMLLKRAAKSEAALAQIAEALQGLPSLPLTQVSQRRQELIDAGVQFGTVEDLLFMGDPPDDIVQNEDGSITIKPKDTP